MAASTFQPQLIPLTRWADGSIRIGNTRILLDLVVLASNEGRTPEEIVTAYPVLKPSEVYGVITYYLENSAEIDDYLASREEAAEQLWDKIESDPDQRQIRQQLPL
ncbi:MAG TPA: DUF433 domain-containing protein [Anaerolineae bacterium]|nr:DUF433 domain-containing protein [Anaerolineae bacterium]